MFKNGTMLSTEPTFRGSADNLFYHDGNTALSKPSGWASDCGCSHGDAGSDALDAIKRISDECKKEHPVASKISGVGRKPFTKCVDSKTEIYNNAIAATKAAIPDPSDAAFASLTSSAASTDSSPSMMLPIIIIAGAGLLFTGLYFATRKPKPIQ